MQTILPITKARKNLTKLVDSADKKLHEFVITVNGEPAAVLMSATEFESWKETVDILSSPKLMKQMKKSEEELEKGNYVTLEELREELNV